MVVPSRNASGGSVSVMRTPAVRVAGSASGPISRTRPLAVMVGAAWSVTVNSVPALMPAISPSGMSTTASRMSGRASVTTTWPALTTWPTSALQAVTTPSTSAFRVA